MKSLIFSAICSEDWFKVFFLFLPENLKAILLQGFHENIDFNRPFHRRSKVRFAPTSFYAILKYGC